MRIHRNCLCLFLGAVTGSESSLAELPAPVSLCSRAMPKYTVNHVALSAHMPASVVLLGVSECLMMRTMLPPILQAANRGTCAAFFTEERPMAQIDIYRAELQPAKAAMSLSMVLQLYNLEPPNRKDEPLCPAVSQVLRQL